MSSTQEISSQASSLNYSQFENNVHFERPNIHPKVELLVRSGFAIHWLHSKSKRPIGEKWSESPVLTLAQLKASYKKGNNVGVRLGKWSAIGSNFLHVIDMDIRKDSSVNEARERLTELFPEWENYPTVMSGSGGASRHFYILTDRPFASKKLAHSEGSAMVFDPVRKRDVKKWDWEIELFGTGKQVVIPPSIHPDTGKPYRWISEFDLDLLDLGFGPYVPSAHIGLLVNDTGETVENDDERNQPLGLSIDEAKTILNDLPDADYREDRDGWLTVGMALHHEFSGSDEAYKVWCDFSKDSEKFDKRDQRRVWKSFKGKAKPVRMATLKNAAREAQLADSFEDLTDSDDFDDDIEAGATDEDFDDLLGEAKPDVVSKRQQKLNKADVEAQLGHEPPKIKSLNKKHAVAFVNGRTVILSENYDGSISYGSVSDLHNFYENDRVATDKATEPVTKAWMRHKKRREYPNGIVFAPGRQIDGAYNHWRGFSVEPDPDASCQLFLQHLRKVICNNDPKAYTYALGWWAHLVQRPWEKPGVAMVVCGKKGVGKDIIADYVGGLFPHHHIKIANQEQLTGKFNAHQEKCILLHVEEGFWAGNKNAEGALKHLITSEKVFIEPKGLNGFHVASVLRLFMSSNEDWVVPATSDERRYFVLNASDEKMQDKAYFSALIKERDSGGRAALLHCLLNHDLSEFIVREVPVTDGLRDQKLASLRDVDSYWYETLKTGEIAEEFGNDDMFSDDLDRGWIGGPVRIMRSDLRNHYLAWFKDQRAYGSPRTASYFGRRLRDLCPKIEDIQGRDGELRPRLYVLPALYECRQLFEKSVGQRVDWD